MVFFLSHPVCSDLLYPLPRPFNYMKNAKWCKGIQWGRKKSPKFLCSVECVVLIASTVGVLLCGCVFESDIVPPKIRSEEVLLLIQAAHHPAALCVVVLLAQLEEAEPLSNASLFAELRSRRGVQGFLLSRDLLEAAGVGEGAVQCVMLLGGLGSEEAEPVVVLALMGSACCAAMVARCLRVDLLHLGGCVKLLLLAAEETQPSATLADGYWADERGFLGGHAVEQVTEAFLGTLVQRRFSSPGWRRSRDYFTLRLRRGEV